MNNQRIIGIALLVIGAVVLVIGMNASESAADQVSNFFTGRFTDKTVWYIAGGTASAVIGLAMLLSGGRFSKT